MPRGEASLRASRAVARSEDTRAVAYERLDRRIGAVTPAELAAVRRILRAFLDL
jgi:hypothetical protein